MIFSGMGVRDVPYKLSGYFLRKMWGMSGVLVVWWAWKLCKVSWLWLWLS